MYTKIFEFKKHVYKEIDEAVSIPEKDTTNLYFIVNKKTSSIQFLIQDKSIIYGYAELIIKPNYYQVINVAAERGYGPFLYDSIMSYLDKPIRPNRSLSHDAYSVWNNYFLHRTDIQKTSINKDDYWNTLDLNNKQVSDKKYLDPINHLYTITDTTRKQKVLDWYNKSLEFQDNMIKLLPKWIDIRFNFAQKWFYNKYM
jgi:hypothetical protein